MARSGAVYVAARLTLRRTTRLAGHARRTTAGIVGVFLVLLVEHLRWSLRPERSAPQASAPVGAMARLDLQTPSARAIILTL